MALFSYFKKLGEWILCKLNDLCSSLEKCLLFTELENYSTFQAKNVLGILSDDYISYASPAEYLCTSSETDNSAQPLLTAEEENQNAKNIPTNQKQKSGDVKRSQDCGTKFKFVSPESNSKLLKLLENH